MDDAKIIWVCTNRRANPELPSCGRRGALEIAELLEKEIARLKLPVSVKQFKCLGMCELGPNIKLSPGGEFIHEAKCEDMLEMMEKIQEFSRTV